MTSTNSGNTKLIQRLDTVQYADSVEWCPLPGQENFLICGTYQLREEETVPEKQEGEPDEGAQTLCEEKSKKTQTRDGGVVLYLLGTSEGQHHLDQVDRLELCGVLDMKWRDRALGQECADESALFSLVNAEGKLQLVSLDKEEEGKLSVVDSISLTEGSLGLSLCWAPKGSAVMASDSAGHLTLADLTPTALVHQQAWQAHEMEAWITAFHGSDANILYSGSDDCKLKRWDLRDLTRPTFVSRRHSMGVTSIQSHPVKEHIFATGSYEEQLLVWDDRQMRSPLTSGSLGGGIWRIKWEPNAGQAILTATMYNGTHILDASDLAVSDLPIIARYADHNLAYGADWYKIAGIQREDATSDKLDKYLISTCSFYDHSLHIWEWSKEKIK